MSLFPARMENFESKMKTWTLIKGCNPVKNLRKTLIYDTNVVLANDDVYTKFCHILSIRSQEIEQKPNSDVIQGL